MRDQDDPPPPEQAIGRQLQRTETEDAGTRPEDGISAAKASGVFDAVRQQYNSSGSPHFMDEDGNLRRRDEARMQDSPAPRDARSPQFGAGAPTRPAWGISHEAGADASSSRSPRAPSPASEDTRPWHTPAITPEDLDPQHFDDDATVTGFHSAPKGRPEVHDLVYRTPGASTPKPALNDLVYRPQPAGSRTPVNDNARSLSDIPKARFQYASDKAAAQQQGVNPAPPGHLVFDEVGPAWYGNPADLAAQASAMGIQYSKQSNPTLTQIRKRSQTLGQGDIYVYSGHGGKVNGKPHLAAHGEADESKGEVPVEYGRAGLMGGYKQKGTGFAVDQLKDDIAQGKNGVPMMVFISGCEVGAKDLSGLNEAGVSMAVSAGGKTSERDAPRQMQTFMDVLTKGGTINEALKAVNEIVDQDNRHKDDEERQEPFTAVFRDGITGDSTLEDLRRHNAQINDERKNGMKKQETPKP